MDPEEYKQSVDETIAGEPIDRFALAEAAPIARPQAPPSSPGRPSPAPALSTQHLPSAPQSLPPSNDESVKSAVELAAASNSLEELRAAVETFDGCGLKKTATNLVFVDGNPDARVLFIGEGPGAEEDRQGVPFVGPSGQLLDKMLSSIGLRRGDVLISNTVFWRPPGNRTPTPTEIAICLPFIERQIELIEPDILVMVGGISAKTLLGRSEGIMRMRGNWFDYASPGLPSPVQGRAIFHPDYLLGSPAHKREAWIDLLEIKARLKSFS